MLAGAYAASIRGIGTKIGTATNSILCGFVQRTLGFEIGFMKYVAFGLRFVAIFIPIVWWALWRECMQSPSAVIVPS
jgi:sodium-dependent dicarboxylate transporter 2/3/5